MVILMAVRQLVYFLTECLVEPQIARISKSSIDINQIAIQNLADPATNDTIKVPFESYSDIQIIHFLAGHWSPFHGRGRPLLADKRVRSPFSLDLRKCTLLDEE